MRKAASDGRFFYMAFGLGPWPWVLALGLRFLVFVDLRSQI